MARNRYYIIDPRYVFIFWLKNCGVFDDSFWWTFINVAVVGSSLLGSILQNYISAENISDRFSTSHFGQISTQNQILIIGYYP
jgi:hypothetical protein